jgi:archaeal preflagellin peptidase FlaK
VALRLRGGPAVASPGGREAGLTTVGDLLLGAQIAVLLAGFAYASLKDWREREVTDRLWQLMAVAGLALGAGFLAGNGELPLVLWFVVGALVLEHLFPWDEHLGAVVERYADLIEGAAYLAVTVVVLVAAFLCGIGPTAVPMSVLSVFATVLFARALFELGVLYGGADAKALMILGIGLPLFATPLLPQGVAASAVLSVVPFSISVLMDAALLSVVIPIGLAVRNLVRGEFRFPQMFTGYVLPVPELPNRFVWVRDPNVPDEEVDLDVETTEEDRKERVRIMNELQTKGVQRVWVTPQIPFLVVMAAGLVAALVAGNLVIDLVSAL